VCKISESKVQCFICVRGGEPQPVDKQNIADLSTKEKTDTENATTDSTIIHNGDNDNDNDFDSGSELFHVYEPLISLESDIDELNGVTWGEHHQACMMELEILQAQKDYKRLKKELAEKSGEPEPQIVDISVPAPPPSVNPASSPGGGLHRMAHL
jgi:hypothetical protein